MTVGELIEMLTEECEDDPTVCNLQVRMAWISTSDGWLHTMPVDDVTVEHFKKAGYRFVALYDKESVEYYANEDVEHLHSTA